MTKKFVRYLGFDDSLSNVSVTEKKTSERCVRILANLIVRIAVIAGIVVFLLFAEAWKILAVASVVALSEVLDML